MFLAERIVPRDSEKGLTDCARELLVVMELDVTLRLMLLLRLDGVLWSTQVLLAVRKVALIVSEALEAFLVVVAHASLELLQQLSLIRVQHFPLLEHPLVLNHLVGIVLN